MFRQSTSFNVNISGWNIAKVTTMQRMFSKASMFNNKLCSWLGYANFPQDVDTDNMFDSSGCDVLGQSDTRVCQYCPFMSKVHLKNAVDLWTSDQISALSRYGHIITWDVSRVKDFSVSFFKCFEIPKSYLLL